MNTDNATNIFASKRSDGNFKPEEIIKDLADFYSGLEYGDVKEEECQIWEYPSGKVFQIEAEGDVPEGEYYTTPGLWRPILKQIGTDKVMIDKAYAELTQ